MLEQGEGGTQRGDALTDGAEVLTGELPSRGAQNEWGRGDGGKTGKTALVSIIVSNKMSHPGPVVSCVRFCACLCLCLWRLPAPVPVAHVWRHEA